MRQIQVRIEGDVPLQKIARSAETLGLEVASASKHGPANLRRGVWRDNDMYWLVFLGATDRVVSGLS